MDSGRTSKNKSGQAPVLHRIHAAWAATCLIIPAMLLTPGISVAAEDDSAKVAVIEDGYIEKMDDYLSLKLRVESATRGIDLDTDGDDYRIRPNSRSGSRISLHYRFISLSYGYYPRFIPGNNDDEFKGETEGRSYSLRLESGHWVQSLAYSRVDGFYLENTSDYVPGWEEDSDSYILFPDLLYKEFKGFTAYKLNRHFSFKALSSQTERQLKSAGSLMPFVLYNYYIIDDRTALTGENSSQKSTNLELLFSLSYFYTLVLSERFYVSAGLAPGAGMLYSDILTRTPEGDYSSSTDEPIYRLEAAGAIGYSSRRFFAGGQVVASWERYEQEGTTAVVVSDRLTYQVFIGYRFDAPGFLTGLTDRAKDPF